MDKLYCHKEKCFEYTSNGSLAVNCGSCLSPPTRLPPDRSIMRRDVTIPPPSSLLVLLMVDLIAFSMFPYVFPCPRSMAWMKE
uniref:Metacaspase-1-like n=1 Tax=Rhizophora mucronata TaxID=61149 RepID=A0A2P2JYL5_RHIMU